MPSVSSGMLGVRRTAPPPAQAARMATSTMRPSRRPQGRSGVGHARDPPVALAQLLLERLEQGHGVLGHDGAVEAGGLVGQVALRTGAAAATGPAYQAGHLGGQVVDQQLGGPPVTGHHHQAGLDLGQLVVADGGDQGAVDITDHGQGRTLGTGLGQPHADAVEQLLGRPPVTQGVAVVLPADLEAGRRAFTAALGVHGHGHEGPRAIEELSGLGQVLSTYAHVWVGA